MGAVGASAVTKVLPESIPARLPVLPDYAWMHYTIWDSVKVVPGEVLNARLLPPPIPKDFVINSIGVHFDAESPYRSVASVAQACHLRMREGGRDMIAAPLYAFGNMAVYPAPLRLVQPAVFHRPRTFGLYLGSEGPVPSADPVVVSVILHGKVRFPMPVA